MYQSSNYCVVRIIAASALLAFTTLTGAALAAEGSSPSAQTTVTTQTTTVRSETTSAAGPASTAAMDRDEMRIKSLHDKLMVKPSQEALWADVARVMRSNDEKMDALTTERHDKAATMTAVDDLRSYGEITEQHAMGTKSFVPVFEKLYDSMSAEQKTNADNFFRARAHKPAKKAD